MPVTSRDRRQWIFYLDGATLWWVRIEASLRKVGIRRQQPAAEVRWKLIRVWKRVDAAIIVA